MRSTGKTTLNAKCHAQEFTAELHQIETHMLSWPTRTLYISTLCPGTYFGLIVTLHCVSLIPTHTEHTRIDYCIVEVVEMQKIRDVWTHILLHISPLLFSFSMSSCPFLFHTLSLEDVSALGLFVYRPTMWLLSLRTAVLPTQNWAAAPVPACRCLTLLRWSERKWLSAVCKVTSVTENQREPGEHE